MTVITEKEKLLLAKFRENIQDIKLTAEQRDDRILIRWIRGKDGDLAKAEEMLRTSMEWRKLNDIDNIQSWEVPECVRTECPVGVTGLDKEGTPVVLTPMGSWDLKKVLANGHKEHVNKLIFQVHDRCLGRVQPNGSTEIVFIADMDHYSLSQFSSKEAVETSLNMMRQFDLNYPESMKSAIFLNSSKVFAMLFPLMKLALGKQGAKMEVFSKGSEKATAFLLDRIPLESLPTKFGGTNVEAQRALYPNEK